MKKLILALLAAMPISNSFAVVVNPDKYYESAAEYGFKGPVKNVSFKEGREFTALAFNEEGKLTQAKAYSSMGTSRIYHVFFGRFGNVTRKVFYDYTDAMCIDCKQVAKTDKDATEKCKNNSDYVKQKIRSNVSYEYNTLNQLARVVSTSADDNYVSTITDYKYNEAGQLVEQATYSAAQPDKRTVKHWSYAGDLLASDDRYDYRYNAKMQLTEKYAKLPGDTSVAYTYYGNGLLKTVALIGLRDTVFFNEKGDTVAVIGKRPFSYRRPDNKLVPEVNGTCVKELIKYNKKREKTYHQYYNEKGAAVFEKYFDEDGNCVKVVFARGFINRVYNSSDKTVTESKYIDGNLTNTAVFNKLGVCIKEEKYRLDGTVSETITREADAYGNVLKEEIVKKEKTVKSTTFKYAYF